ncbi:RtcB family protein [Mesorhizobium sp. M0016]|uniref:RtcB family protein n=1 Tax=Mesorhizobium sp. M0016 TaxID=2956843 RepID=UPI0033355D7D
MYTGKDLIAWGFKPGPLFPDMIRVANSLDLPEDQIKAWVAKMEPTPIPQLEFHSTSRPFGVFLDASTHDELANKQSVLETMDVLMRLPTVVKAVVMPDACPAGVIPVGGVVATKDAIHPGFHSADVCCSMAITVFKRNDDPKKLLDTAMRVTKFGPEKRKSSDLIKVPKHVLDMMKGNPFLAQSEDIAQAHFATQGDGNHFLFVGHLESTGQLAMVTHHGSRGLGAQLYKRGMLAARRHTAIVARRAPPAAAWLDATSEQGLAYWDALQTVREWTYQSHFAIHHEIARRMGNAMVDAFWNEHNFVFKRDDGLFYHAKGATPSYNGYERTLIPMNMAEPILITAPTNNEDALSFAPHGAGRNMSRTQFLRSYMPEPPANIDIRYYTGMPDPSELPEAYKSAAGVIAQIKKYDLATITDRVLPYGNIMAGDTAWKRPS